MGMDNHQQDLLHIMGMEEVIIHHKTKFVSYYNPLDFSPLLHVDTVNNSLLFLYIIIMLFISRLLSLVVCH